MFSYHFNNEIEIEIHWNPQTLRHLESSPYFHVYGGINEMHDCPNDDFSLKSLLFTSTQRGDNPGNLKYFECLLNGSSNIIDAHNPYKIRLINRAAKFDLRPVAPEFFKLVHLDRVFFDRTELFAQLAIFSLVDEKVSYILQSASTGNSLTNQFKILDTMIHDADVKALGFKIDSRKGTDYERLTYTANSPAISGVEARHGINEKKDKPTSRVIPMTHKEAHSFIKGEFEKYFHLKVKSFGGWV